MPKPKRRPRVPLESRPPFSQRLVRARTRKGLSQTELAELSSVSQSMIADYEIGTTRPVGVVAARIANALGISIFDVTGRYDGMTDEEVYEQKRAAPGRNWEDSNSLDDEYAEFVHRMSAIYAEVRYLRTEQAFAINVRLIWGSALSLKADLPLSEKISLVLEQHRIYLSTTIAKIRGSASDQQ